MDTAQAMIGKRVQLRKTIVTTTRTTFRRGTVLRVTGTEHPHGYPQRCRVLILHDGRGRILKVWRRSVMAVRDKS